MKTIASSLSRFSLLSGSISILISCGSSQNFNHPLDFSASSAEHTPSPSPATGNSQSENNSSSENMANSPSSSVSDDLSSSPVPVGSYPGYTYSLPTSRPFISLRDYDSISRTSAAYLRLKAQVDDVVNITNGLNSSATYSQLVSALNSGHYGYSVVDSVVMYRLTSDVKYIQQAIRMTDLFIISENQRINAGSNPGIAGDSYLEVGAYMEELALTYDYGIASGQLSDTAKISAWQVYAAQVLFNVWNYNSARWGVRSAPWSGWSVDDPGNNYHFSFLKATQLWALATRNTAPFSYGNQSMSLISFLQNHKYNPLVAYYSILIGGGSREGTGYGTAHKNLFENFRYWKSSTGEDLAALSSHVRDTIDYWIHATTPSLTHFASIGDQARSSMPLLFDYHRQLVQEAAALNAGTDQARRGAWWLNRIQVTDGGSGTVTGRMRYNFNFRYDLLASSESELAPTDLVYYARGVGALFARSDWTTTASWVSTVAGPYDQSHAHQDQGSFTFVKGTWLAATPNIFSRSGINQDVGTHNIVRFMMGTSVIPQNNAVSSMTYSDASGILTINQNLTPAYSSHSSSVTRWTRRLTYTRSTHTLQVHDQCSVAAGVTPIFQIHVPVQPTVVGNVVTAGNLRITQTTPSVSAANTPRFVSMPSVNSDFSAGYRIELTGAGCEFLVTLQAL